ncbi:MAG TPA: response regulator [Candidatus Melainabacteria bacterium]|nr:response regulator [Candidatus Melainabacteria bacterium]
MTMKVLIIDDEEDNRQIANLALTMIGGFTVIEADGGELGLKLAEAEKPDVILLDFVMPNMNGLETLKALRRNPLTEKIPVIFVSTKSLQEREKELFEAGAQGILPKPFNPTQLPEKIKEITGLGA